MMHAMKHFYSVVSPVLFGLFIALFGMDFAFAMARKPPEIPIEFAEQKPSLAPLTLEESYRLALRRSESLAIEKEEIAETWADFLQASGEAIGDARFVINHFRQEPQGSGIAEGGATGQLIRAERKTRQFVLTQPLFQGFRTLGALRGAGALREAQIGEYRRAEQILFLDVAAAYFSVLQRQRDIRIQEDILSLFQSRIGELSEWVKIGKSRESEAISAQSRLKLAEAELASIKRELAFEIRILEFLTGISLENRLLVEPEKPYNVPEDLGNYLAMAESRPDVQSAKAVHHAAKQAVIIAQSELWPQISLTNNWYEEREGVQSGIDWDLLFTIDVPLFTGGSTAGEIKEALSEVKKADFSYSRALRLAELEIKQAYEAWQATLNESRALDEAVLAARRNYEIQAEEYERNLVNNLEVLDALETFNDVQIEAGRAYYSNKLNYWRLKVAAGECCGSTIWEHEDLPA